MPIDLVIDERDPTAKPLELGGSTNGNEGTRSNADSTSHTDGASTPDVVSPARNSFSRFAATFRAFDWTTIIPPQAETISVTSIRNVFIDIN